MTCSGARPFSIVTVGTYLSHVAAARCNSHVLVLTKSVQNKHKVEKVAKKGFTVSGASGAQRRYDPPATNAAWTAFYLLMYG
eukprot:6409125-Amphidinium_carterae.1